MFAATQVAAQAVALVMLFTWVASVIQSDASLVDRVWGVAFVAAAFAVAITAGLWGLRTIMLLVLVSLWGLRLSVYLTVRNYGHGEDGRYQAMRANRRKSFWWRSLITVYGLQAVLATLIAAPLVYALSASPAPAFFWLDGVAALVVVLGVGLETVADYQLAQFRRDETNRTRVLNTGLWGYSRHPNYVGDAIVWVGFALFGIAAGGWFTVYGPVLMIVFLRRLSGVSLTEKRILAEGRRVGYADYVATTPAFLPRFSRPNTP